MRGVNSYTDYHTYQAPAHKEIEDHAGHTSVSEGIDPTISTFINYATFGIIKLSEPPMTETTRRGAC